MSDNATESAPPTATPPNPTQSRSGRELLLDLVCHPADHRVIDRLAGFGQQRLQQVHDEAEEGMDQLIAMHTTDYGPIGAGFTALQTRFHGLGQKVSDAWDKIDQNVTKAAPGLHAQLEGMLDELAETYAVGGDVYRGVAGTLPQGTYLYGDYCSGTNHVLPTYGFARNYSGLGLDQFLRSMTVQELTVDGLRSLGDARLFGIADNPSPRRHSYRHFIEMRS